MNKLIKVIVWAFLVSIVASTIGIVSNAFAEDNYKTLSHQYNLVYSDLLVKKIHTFKKNEPVVLYLKDGTEVAGVFKGYSEYDDSIWVKVNGDWLQTGYGINELFDVSINIKRLI